LHILKSLCSKGRGKREKGKVKRENGKGKREGKRGKSGKCGGKEGKLFPSVTPALNYFMSNFFDHFCNFIH
jgi:hypothetical protein